VVTVIKFTIQNTAGAVANRISTWYYY